MVQIGDIQHIQFQPKDTRTFYLENSKSRNHEKKTGKKIKRNETKE